MLLLTNPESARNNPTVLSFKMLKVSSKNSKQLLALAVLPLRSQQLATMRNSLMNANKG